MAYTYGVNHVLLIQKTLIIFWSLRVLRVSVVKFLFRFEIDEAEGNTVLGGYELEFRFQF